ncbi:unnamed protein product, partial [Symbiodinium necroappetens]
APVPASTADADSAFETQRAKLEADHQEKLQRLEKEHQEILRQIESDFERRRDEKTQQLALEMERRSRVDAERQ